MKISNMGCHQRRPIQKKTFKIHLWMGQVSKKKVETHKKVLKNS